MRHLLFRSAAWYVVILHARASSLGALCRVGTPVLALYPGSSNKQSSLFGSKCLGAWPQCWLKGVISKEVDEEWLLIAWIDDVAEPLIVNRANVRGPDTVSCLQSEPPMLMGKWSRNFRANFLAEPHPLCQSRQRDEGFNESDVMAAMKWGFNWEDPLTANRQPGGLRSFSPESPVYDVRPSGAPLGLSLVRDAEHRVIGATWRSKRKGRRSSTWRLGYSRGKFNLKWNESVAIMIGMNPGVVRGRTFLETGAVDGMNCFHAEQLGATSVLCVDYHAWGGREDADTHVIASVFQSAHAFKLVHCLRKSRVRAMRVNVYDLSPDLVGGCYDVVRSFGLLYHLKHPVLGLQALSSVTCEALVLETETLAWAVPVPPGYQHPDLAVCQWFRGDELADDRTNFWACNDAAILSMLTDVGFQEVAVIWRGGALGKTTGRRTYLALKPNASLTVADFNNYVV